MKTHRTSKPTPLKRIRAVKRGDGAARRSTNKRKDSLMSLKVNENKLLTLFENSHDGIAYLDTSGVILDVNPAAVKIFGGTKEDLVGKQFSTLKIFPLDEPVIHDHFRRVLSGETASIDSYITNKSGEQRFLRSSSTLVKTDGKTIGVIVIIQDATEQKLAEKALQDSEERYRVFIENFHGIFFQGGMDLQPLFFHGALEDITGYTQQDFITGKLRWDKLICKEDLIKIKEGTAKIKNVPDYSMGREYRIVCKNGTIKWVYEFIRNICDDSGKPVKVQGAVFDITDRKKTDEMLHVTHERLEYLLRSTSVAIYSSKVSGDYGATSITDTVTDIIGFKPEDFLNDSSFWINHIHHDDRDHIISELPRLFETGTYEYEYRFRHKNGSYRWIRDEMRLIRDTKGNPVEIVGFWIDITRRKRAEDALRESEAMLKSILQAAPVGIGVVKNRIINWTNETLHAMTGYAAEELAGKSARILYPADEDYNYVGEEKYRQIRELGSGTVETRWKRKDGTVIDILLSSIPINPDDLSEGVTFTALDITVRKRRADLLHIQRDLSIAFGSIRDIKGVLDRLLETALQVGGIDCGGVYLCDMESGGLDLISNKGFPPEFVESARHYDADAPQTVLVMKGEPVYTSHIKLGVPVNDTRKKEGLRAIAVIPLKYESQVIGALNMASHTYDEITEEQKNILETVAGMVGGTIARVSAESALRINQQNLQILFNTVDDFLFIINTDLQFIEVNLTVIERIGYSREELSSMRVLDLHPKDQRKEAERVMADILAGKTSLCIIPIETKSGKLIPVETKIVRGTWDDKEVLFAISRDISSRIKLEEQLLQSEKMEAIGQLAGGIAHDFNNQLSGIMGYADLIREDVRDNPQLSRFADNIIISTRRAADLTAQLLAFARKGKFLSIPVNIHKLIVEVVALLQRSIDKRIDIKQRLNANPPMTRGDPTQLQSAILNLAINAGDAMPDGGELIISTDIIELDEAYSKENLVFEVTPGHYLQVCVTDTGVGMDEEIKKHIFEPFFTTKEIGKGTGMGLPAVYGTVKSHKGSISFYTEPGRGTAFKVFLPLYLEGVEMDAESLLKEDYIKGSAQILLVDDEELVRAVAQDMLESIGYTVVTCNNGNEALDYYTKEWNAIDLVILDMIMPQKGGKDTFLAMREINPGIVALLSSGYSIDRKTEQLFDLGVKGFVQKPYTRSDLSKKVAEALNIEITD